jgi:hypothetical protein
MSLSELQTAWIKEADRCITRNPVDYWAAPFLSVLPGPSERDRGRRVLLVGKATAGPWHCKEFLANSARPIAERVEERRLATLGHLRWRERNRTSTSAFWRFWRKLHSIASVVIWSNLAKLGVTSGNPCGEDLKSQMALAQKTLRAEVDEYAPYLVVLVTGDYAGNEIVCPTFGSPECWEHAEDGEYWSIGKTRQQPAILWIEHPQGKAASRVDKWLAQARHLMN